MATFKVGDKARIVGPARAAIDHEYAYLFGVETVITSGRLTHQGVGYYCTEATDGSSQVRGINESNLAPLLPPDSKADEFIERLRKLGSEPHPVREVA